MVNKMKTGSVKKKCTFHVMEGLHNSSSIIDLWNCHPIPQIVIFLLHGSNHQHLYIGLIYDALYSVSYVKKSAMHLATNKYRDLTYTTSASGS